jgi:signal transduction histidine kinase
VHLAVPVLADLCAVDVVTEHGVLKRLAAHHWNEEKNALAQTLSRLIEERRPMVRGSPILEAIRTHQGVIIPEVSHAHIRASVPDPDYADLLCRIGLTSTMYAPMVSRGRVHGVLLLGRTSPGRPYRPDDLLVAEEIARRAAVAYENASLYREAQRAILLRDDFLSIAAHELQTPLTSLLLKLEMLKRRMSRHEQAVPGANADIAQLFRQAERVKKLVGNVLDVSRMALGHPKIRVQWLDLALIVREEASRLELEASQASCEIHCQLAERVMGQWDPIRLEQVISNLLSNAIKYGAGHPIEVTLTVDQQTACLVVRDHGIGIAAPDLARVFGRFERAVSARHYGGLGLGLFITKQIVEAHGGKVHVDSEIGQGSRFVVHLPLCRDPADASNS